MRAVKSDNKWEIHVFTKEFGEVVMLKEEGLIPLTFHTKDEALNFIQKVREENDEIVKSIKNTWKQHRENLNEAKTLYGVNELYSMNSRDIEQVEWLVGHTEMLNGHINSLQGETKNLEKNKNEEKQYNETFLKLLRTQSCITDVIDLINERFESEEKGEKYEW